MDWRLHPPSTIRPLRKHFTSKFHAGYREYPDDGSSEGLADLLLMYAVLDHDPKNVQAILESAGPDQIITRSYFWVCLGAAVAWGYEVVVRVFLDAGADPNILVPCQDQNVVPMMYLALRYGHKQVATLLYERGALLDLPGDNPEFEFAVAPVFGAMASQDVTLLDFVLGLGASIP